MSWLLLAFAGILETLWAAGLKAASEKSGVALVVATGVAMVASLVLLYLAMTRLPLGVAYPIWTGIGTVGSVALSVFWFGQGVGLPGLVGVGLLLAGMAALYLDTLL